MKLPGSFSAAGRRISRLCRVAAIVSAVWLLVVAATTLVRLGESVKADARDEVRAAASAPDAARRQGPAAAWGSEVLAVAREQATELTPIPVANACGIGASSCFKCHNGARAAAPKADRATSPWHVQHKTVNDSCVGCHGGNARLIKKEIAHTNLIKDPRTSVEQCTHCHKSGDPGALLKTYQVAAAGGK